MLEREINAKVHEWEAAGFEFIGHGAENNEDDPNLCPSCGRAHIFWALWGHPTRTRYAETDSEYNPLLLNSTNLCVSCGFRWIDEDEVIANRS